MRIREKKKGRVGEEVVRSERREGGRKDDVELGMMSRHTRRGKYGEKIST